jgi:RimJ/RimL family protein N-acetyltransferase
VLTTARLLLRGWSDDDREPFARLNGDARVMRYFPGMLDRAQSDAMVDRLQEHEAVHGYTLWVVEVVTSARGASTFAGFTGLVRPTREMPFAHDEPLVEVGWRLLPAWWGLGIATEAARASLAHGFDEAGLREIVSFTVPSNAASQAVMGRVGMTADGDFDHPAAQPHDWWRRHVLYRMRSTDPRP